ncbi:hypothetical protein SAMN05518683_12431 [Salibacterium halotolerans]|uniref:Uncharacterized protein n=1 Tax=Salibacterium halotolerans TaxID=1884432 RepID=A0A1I5X2G5_9BACI|nr:hypothetical protein SAMN05518683_12431 [Salibacterium halotolerans]
MDIRHKQAYKSVETYQLFYNETMNKRGVFDGKVHAGFGPGNNKFKSDFL